MPLYDSQSPIRSSVGPTWQRPPNMRQSIKNSMGPTNPVTQNAGTPGSMKATYAQQPWNGPLNNNGRPVVGGYENNGIQTDRFQQQYGRSPTTSDYEKTFGGLSPSHDQIGGLDDFYAGKTKDPNTGLSLMPSAWDKMQQQSALQKKGDFEGSQAIKNYYNSGGAYNPQAGQNLENYKAQRESLQRLNAANSSPNNPFNSAAPANFNNSLDVTPAANAFPRAAPLPAQPSLDSFPAGPPMPAQPDLTGKAKGGPTQVHPYMVGEKGDELWTGKDGEQEMLGMDGPEIRTFDQPGYVTPHNKLPPELKAPHRYMGGPVEGGSIGRTVGPWVGSGMSPGGLPIFGKQYGTGSSIFSKGFDPATGTSSSVDPQLSGMSFFAKGGHTKSSPRRELMQVTHRFTGGATQGNPQMGDEDVSVEQPSQEEADARTSNFWKSNAQMPLPLGLPHYTPNMNNAFFNAFTRQPPVADVPHGTNPVPQTPEQELLARLAQPAPNSGGDFRPYDPLPFTALSAPTDTAQNFGTPYGKVGMNFGTKEPTMIEGLPADEWFQRAANRQGEGNKYTTPEKGYESADSKQGKFNRLNRLAKLGQTDKYNG